MRDESPAPLTTPLPEEVFQLNLSYLLLARRLVVQDVVQAEIVLGVREPLTSWLREASAGAIATLANSPVRGPRAAAAAEGGGERARRLQRWALARPRPCGACRRRGVA